MLAAYAPLFRVPGAARFILGTAFSRVGGSMFGVAIIVMLSERRDSFGLAGAISAVGVLVLAIAGPVIGRLVDRFGQRRVALPFVTTSAVFCTSTALLSLAGAPVWTIFVGYGLSANIPEPGPMSRARWAHIFHAEPDRLHTAMSFEQVADEASFVVGPVLAVLVSTLWFPEAGLLLAELLFTIGMIAFLFARETEPPVVPAHDRPGGLAIRRPGLLLVAIVLTMTGVIFGANEVVAVAFAKEQAATLCMQLRIVEGEWVTKVRNAWSDEPDTDEHAWCGIVPMTTTYGAPQPAPWSEGQEVPESVRRLSSQTH